MRGTAGCLFVVGFVSACMYAPNAPNAPKSAASNASRTATAATPETAQSSASGVSKSVAPGVTRLPSHGPTAAEAVKAPSPEVVKSSGSDRKSASDAKRRARSSGFAAQAPSALIAGTPVAVAYSGYRRGQRPGGQGDGQTPTPAQLQEDLRLLMAHGVRLIRLYNVGDAREVLAVIDQQALPMQVVLGAWLRAEVSAHETCAWLTEPIPDEQLVANRQANEAEVDTAIALARAHPRTVAAVNVGNEALVKWNDHLVSVERVVGYLKRVRSAIQQPVTTADNYLAWVEHAAALAPAVDFAFVHTYPVWEGKTLNEAMPFTRANLTLVQKALPHTPMAIGEAGWATTATEFGERASEENQAKYVADLLAFGREHNMTIFVFEAFDEDWKGNNDPNGAEKHWGLFDIDRRPKAGVATGRILKRIGR